MVAPGMREDAWLDWSSPLLPGPRGRAGRERKVIAPEQDSRPLSCPRLQWTTCCLAQGQLLGRNFSLKQI